MKLITKKNLWIWIIVIIIVIFLLRVIHKKSKEGFEIAIESGGVGDIGNVKPLNTTYINSANQSWTSKNNNNMIVVNEANLAKSIQFGPPLGNSVTAHEKINRIIDGIKNELTSVFAQMPEILLNTPLNKLPYPMSVILKQPVSSLFPITSAAMNMPLNELLNTENSLNQIADRLQPPNPNQAPVPP